MPDPIRCVIADDEPPARRLLRRFLDERDDIVVAAEAGSGREAVDAIRLASPDVVFLDVSMPELNGFEVLASLPADEAPLVVFVTAYDEYAVRAFDVNAVDYLLKPFEGGRVHAAVDRVVAAIERESGAARDRARAALPPAADGRERTYLRRLAVPHGERSEIIRVEAIDRFEAERKYVRLWTGGRSHLVRRPISLMAKVLDPAVFVQLSRSAIVNIERIREVVQPTPRDCHVRLEDGARVKVTRGYQGVVDRLLFDLE
ncbi:LytTR family DNA-binding domain-containing protein [Roseisolibacter sp. H3M3-2]|uniref:LytR/AlgR family response regulator transcription factor n=1 Tax=Roseisolibacter sp. H3M3-2 TaxID=3031323 RepID=UPI0023DA2A14|nr:LytTR family DNA-binding domain-containing protein [Roseisolibacter sp. H3M3-2]MDF1503457.1 LytTR family DNA-binding domain-containing protein [Roseisolibacter sp. H3M3-2]